MESWVLTSQKDALTILIDDFRLYQENHEVSSIEGESFMVAGIERNIKNYYPLEYGIVNLQILDSLDNAILYQKAVISDGYGSWFDIINFVDYPVFLNISKTFYLKTIVITEYSLSMGTRMLLHMNEASGTSTSDLTDYNNDGTVNSAIWYEYGEFGYSLQNDNADAKNIAILDSASISLTTNFILRFWLYIDAYATSGYDVYLYKDGSFELAYNYASNLLYFSGGTCNLQCAPPSIGEWHNIIITFSSGSYSQANMYLDFELVSYDTSPGTITDTANPLYLMDKLGFQYGANAIIDEVELKSLNYMTMQDILTITSFSTFQLNSEVVEIHFASNYAFCTSPLNSFLYYAYLDNQFISNFADLEFIELNSTIGTHNLTVIPYFDSLLSDSLVIFLGDPVTSFYAVTLGAWQFTNLQLDISDFYIQFTFATTWNNLSASIYENGTLQGSTNENEVFIYARNTTYDITRNITIIIEDISLQYFYKNAPAPLEDDWLFTDLYFNVGGYYIEFEFQTSWNNLSASIYENSTLKGSVNESIVFSYERNTQYDMSLNVTILIEDVILTYWYKNAPESLPETPIYSVYFSYCDGVGLGLEFSNFKLYVNNSRQYSQSLEVENNTLLILEVTDYFDVSLFTQNYTILNNTEITIILDIYEVIFRNNNTQFEAIVSIGRGTKILNLTVAPEGAISHRFTEGEYLIEIYYNVKEQPAYSDPAIFNVGVHSFSTQNLRIGSKLQLLDSTSKLKTNLNSNIVDVGGPTYEPPLIFQILQQFGFAAIVITFIVAIIGAVIAVGIREGWWIVKAKTFNKGPEDSLIVSNNLEAEEDRVDTNQKRENLNKTKHKSNFSLFYPQRREAKEKRISTMNRVKDTL